MQNDRSYLYSWWQKFSCWRRPPQRIPSLTTSSNFSRALQTCNVTFFNDWLLNTCQGWKKRFFRNMRWAKLTCRSISLGSPWRKKISKQTRHILESLIGHYKYNVSMIYINISIWYKHLYHPPCANVMHDPHALSIFHRELISKLEGHVSRCYTFFERGSIYKAKMMFFSVFILLYWSWYLLKLTCLCQNLDGVVTEFSNAELLISAMKFFKSTHGIEKQGNDQRE